MSEMMDSRLHIMLDIEAAGNTNNAAITSIGAVSFDIDGVYSSFDMPVSLEDSVRCGLTISPSTFLWWMKQSEDAKKQFEANKDVPEQSLSYVLTKFNEWYLNQRGKQVWGKGYDFDGVIMETAYNLTGIKLPWGYQDHRCFRTMFAQHPEINYEQFGILHNGVDDAKSQALHLIKIAKLTTGLIL